MATIGATALVHAGDVSTGATRSIGKRILFLGNSITLHPPKAEIGWTNNFVLLNDDVLIPACAPARPCRRRGCTSTADARRPSSMHSAGAYFYFCQPHVLDLCLQTPEQLPAEFPPPAAAAQLCVRAGFPRAVALLLCGFCLGTLRTGGKPTGGAYP